MWLGDVVAMFSSDQLSPRLGGMSLCMEHPKWTP